MDVQLHGQAHPGEPRFRSRVLAGRHVQTMDDLISIVRELRARGGEHFDRVELPTRVIRRRSTFPHGDPQRTVT